jgi:hypothetical protein
VDDAPTTKEPILERSRCAIEAIDRALASLNDDQLVARPDRGGWSLRDVLAHMAADLRWFSEQLEAKLGDRLPDDAAAFTALRPPPEGVDLSTQDGRNAAQYELNRHLLLDEVRERWVTYRERVLAAVEGLPDGGFSVPHTIAQHGFAGHVRPASEGEEGWPLWRWIAGNAWHHFEDHFRDFEAAAARSE